MHTIEPYSFGLAFDVEKDPFAKSGYRPAPVDLASGLDPFADLRLMGFAAAIRANFSKRLVIVGGEEERYAGEMVQDGEEMISINRAWAICRMLVFEHDVPSGALSWAPSGGNTFNNAKEIKRHVGERRSDFTIISSHFHLPRAAHLFRRCEMRPALVPAEALILYAAPPEEWEEIEADLIERFGNGLLAERAAREIRGFADDYARVQLFV